MDENKKKNPDFYPYRYYTYSKSISINFKWFRKFNKRRRVSNFTLANLIKTYSKVKIDDYIVLASSR